MTENTHTFTDLGVADPIVAALAEAGLHIATPPIDLAPVTMSMAWHARHHDLPEHKWLRGVIAGAG